jgi:hypothetical protein
MLQILDTVQAQPTVVYVQQAAGGMSEFTKVLIAASVGAVFGIGGNIAMEFLKPRIAKRSLKREIIAQLSDEIKRNLKHLNSVRDVIQAAEKGEPMNYEHAHYLISNVWDDRFRHYLADEPIMVYEIDRNKSLEEFYQLAKLDLNAAIIKGGISESVAGPGTAAEIVEWAIHWGSSFIRFHNRPLKFRFDDWLGVC